MPRLLLAWITSAAKIFHKLYQGVFKHQGPYHRSHIVGLLFSGHPGKKDSQFTETAMWALSGVKVRQIWAASHVRRFTAVRGATYAASSMMTCLAVSPEEACFCKPGQHDDFQKDLSGSPKHGTKTT